MKYNLYNPTERDEARGYLSRLVESAADKSVMVEIKRISPRRSLNQNAYLHLILSDFGQHFGYTIEESKTIYKRDINADTYIYEKNHSKFLRSSADLTKEEMAKSIDKLMGVSAEMGYPLPPATDIEWMRRIENEIEKQSRYM